MNMLEENILNMLEEIILLYVTPHWCFTISLLVPPTSLFAKPTPSLIVHQCTYVLLSTYVYISVGK